MELSNKIQICLKFRYAFSISAFFFVSQICAQPLPPGSLLDSISEYSLKSDLYYLSSPELKGRGNSSPELRAAASFIETKFSEYGLKKIPELKGTFYLKKDSVLPDPLLIGDKKYQYARDYYTSWPKKKKKITANGIIFASNDIQKWTFSKTLLRGKALVIVPGIAISDDTTRQHLMECIALAKEAGAALVMIPHLQFFELNGLRGLDAYHSKFTLIPNIQKAGIPVIYTSWQIVGDLMGNESFSELLKDPYREKFQGLEFKKKLSLTYKHGSVAKALNNVAGYIAGKDTNDILLIGAHYDHLGNLGREIYFGANDNASGTSALLELAKTFGIAAKEGLQPQRTIVFVAFAAEEMGLLGSRDLTSNNDVFMQKVSAMINMDMLGRRDRDSRKIKDYIFVMANDLLSKDWNSILNNVHLHFPGITPDFSINKNNDPEYLLQRSDQYSFLKKGIPSLFFHDGAYTDYHSPTDTPDKIDYSLLQKRTQFIFLTAWEVAFRKEKLSVDPSMK